MKMIEKLKEDLIKRGRRKYFITIAHSHIHNCAPSASP
jgi:hypothetical protein